MAVMQKYVFRMDSSLITLVPVELHTSGILAMALRYRVLTQHLLTTYMKSQGFMMYDSLRLIRPHVSLVIQLGLKCSHSFRQLRFNPVTISAEEPFTPFRPLAEFPINGTRWMVTFILQRKL